MHMYILLFYSPVVIMTYINYIIYCSNYIYVVIYTFHFSNLHKVLTGLKENLCYYVACFVAIYGIQIIVACEFGKAEC